MFVTHTLSHFVTGPNEQTPSAIQLHGFETSPNYYYFCNINLLKIDKHLIFQEDCQRIVSLDLYCLKFDAKPPYNDTPAGRPLHALRMSLNYKSIIYMIK
jgi:hypothetical protein